MTASHAFFVTGTDTGVGKTLVSAALLHAFGTRGLRTAAMKPIAAGAEQRDGVWWNEDTDTLTQAANAGLPADITTPYLLKEAIAPHIAACAEGVSLDIRRIVQCYQAIAQAADCVVVEGVGGFRVPLNAAQDTADLACALKLPLILVVGLRLGCLNHALLTVEAIAARKLSLAGWIANHIDPLMRHTEANVETLQVRFASQYNMPLLGRIPYLQTATARAAVSYLHLESVDFL